MRHVAEDDEKDMGSAGASTGELRSFGRRRGRKISAFCHLPFHGLNLSCPDSRVMEYSREVIKEGLEIGIILGCKVAILHTGFSSQIRPRQVEAWKSRFIESMKELVTAAANGAR